MVLMPPRNASEKQVRAWHSRLSKHPARTPPPGLLPRHHRRPALMLGHRVVVDEPGGPQGAGVVRGGGALGASIEPPYHRQRLADAIEEAVAVSHLARMGSERSSSRPEAVRSGNDRTLRRSPLQIIAELHRTLHGTGCCHHALVACHGARLVLHKRPGDINGHIDFILPDGTLDCPLVVRHATPPLSLAPPNLTLEPWHYARAPRRA